MGDPAIAAPPPSLAGLCTSSAGMARAAGRGSTTCVGTGCPLAICSDGSDSTESKEDADSAEVKADAVAATCAPSTRARAFCRMLSSPEWAPPSGAAACCAVAAATVVWTRHAARALASRCCARASLALREVMSVAMAASS